MRAGHQVFISRRVLKSLLRSLSIFRRSAGRNWNIFAGFGLSAFLESRIFNFTRDASGTPGIGQPPRFRDIVKAIFADQRRHSTGPGNLCYGIGQSSVLSWAGNVRIVSHVQLL